MVLEDPADVGWVDRADRGGTRSSSTVAAVSEVPVTGTDDTNACAPCGG